MTAKNLLRSIAGSYLYFNRADSYADFPTADQHDGEQVPNDREGNATARFEKAPDFSAADYYDQSRARTYACCFSLENSPFIWENYGTGDERGKVCFVFNFGKLRATLNRTLEPGNAALEYEGLRCHQIFSINYGVVEYVDWANHRANIPHLPNPVKYTYLKDRARFGEEKELRISLSTIGLGGFVLNDGKKMEFPPNLQMQFNFRAAIADGTIEQIIRSPDSDTEFLKAELRKFNIATRDGDSR